MEAYFRWLLVSAGGETSAQLGAQLLHVVGGGLLVYFHGWHKLKDGLAWFNGRREQWPFREEVRAAGFPAATLNAWLATVAQFGGGLLLVSGLLTRPVALVLAGTLCGAVYTTIVLKKEPQMALVYLVLMLAVFLLGPGPWSLDVSWLFPLLTHGQPN